MSFAERFWLAWLSLAPVLAVVLAVGGWWHRRALRRVFSAQMLERIVPIGVRRRRTLRDGLVWLALCLLVVALAEPRFDKAVRTLNVRGTDIIVLLDLSRSMDAQDVDPSRLERARREIADLGRVVEGDRVGLVVFAGGAYPRLPLTADLKAVDLVVSEARTDAFDSQGSDLGTAIRVSMELLDRTRQEAGQALLVLSDGEIHDREDALAAADEAAARGVPIYVMGIGIEPAPIPLPDGRMLTWQGSPVTTTPDFEVLKEAARRTGGAFVTSNAGSRDMEQLYAELRRSVQAADRSTQQRETWRSAFQIPLGIGVGLLLLAGWLGDGRRRYGAATAAALVAVGLAWAPSTARAADPLAEADRLYQEGKYPQAIERLVDLSLQRPGDAEVLERLGAARYRAGDFDGAARAYDQAVRLSGDRSGDAAYNAGNAYYLAGKLEDALSRYDRVLQDRPEHEAAKHNQELVTKEIAARRALPPPPPPKPGGGEEQDEGAGDQQDPQENPGDPKDEQGQPNGDPQPGDEQDQGEPEDQQGSEGQGQPGEQERDPKEGQQPGSAGGSPEPPDGEPTSDGQGGAAAGEAAEGPITEGQAHRLLDSVEEGSQRMLVRGRPEQKPW